MGLSTWQIDPIKSTVGVRAKSTLHGSASSGTGIGGKVHGDLDDLASTAGGWVEVPVIQQTFGSRMQDFAMQKHLDVKRWPTVRFTIDEVSVESREPWKVTLTGTVEYKKNASITLQATGRLDDDRIEARAVFPLSLTAIGVKPPRMLFLKVEDEVEVEVSIVATRIDVRL